MPSTSQIVMPRASLGWRMWAPSAAMMSCGVLAYIDRQALAVLSPTILQDTGLSAEAYATALSAFSFAYMIGNPLWGSFLDFVGLRVGMLLAVTLWTLASVSHAWVGSLLGLIVARAVLGFGEGAAFFFADGGAVGAEARAALVGPLGRQEGRARAAEGEAAPAGRAPSTPPGGRDSWRPPASPGCGCGWRG